MQKDFNQNLYRWRKSVIKYRIEASEASGKLRKIIQKAKADKQLIRKLTHKFGKCEFSDTCVFLSTFNLTRNSRKIL